MGDPHSHGPGDGSCTGTTVPVYLRPRRPRKCDAPPLANTIGTNVKKECMSIDSIVGELHALPETVLHSKSCLDSRPVLYSDP